MAQKLTKRKIKALGIRIKPKEGLWIKYQLGIRGVTLTGFANQSGVSVATISNVLRGMRKSAPVERAIVRTLGYSSFETMIAAARGKGIVA